MEPWAATSLAKAFDALVHYSRTEKSMRQPLQKHFLRITHPVAQKIVRLREFNKANTTFMKPFLSIRITVVSMCFHLFVQMKGHSYRTIFFVNPTSNKSLRVTLKSRR